ncbi:hypothetical protein [Bacillus sp. AFS029533]|uniref:hypothetical protein n=1 Tax=Bacillus sp. AFS029533 TaxID=2033494 RepID=UPI000BFDEA34|nr:hypothetical protein [Bacillus sp. AFS029533]PGZ92239.1 hypothetical protein COE53_12815 [Bacillus sp. AFS029533]
MHEKPIYLIKPRIFTSDKYYKVYVKGASLIFVKLGGQFYVENAVEEQHFILGLVFSFFRKKVFAKKRSVFEANMDKEIEINPDSLLAKKSNFKIDLNSLKSIQINNHPTFHSGWEDNGSVKMTLINGKNLKFNIPKSVSTKSIITIFESENLPIQNVF